MDAKESEIYKKRWVILLTVLCATFMATLDGSIVNVALPDMSNKLDVSMAEIEWVVTSFLITIVATILIFGRLGDIKGKTKIFQLGIIIFTFGSLLCGLTNSLWVLVAARMLQAIGAAATMANNQGIVTQVFPPSERGRALGILGTSAALGAMAGPPVGGLIVSVMNWKYIFLINVPIGIIVFILTMKIFPKVTGTQKEKFDTKGTFMFLVAVIMLFSALVQGQTAGYSNSIVVISVILGMVTFGLFVWTESKIEAPLLYLKIFKNSLFSISIVCGFISYVASSASNIILPFYFQETLKLSPATTGFLMMVSPIILAIVAPFSGYLSDKIGSEILTLIGLGFTSLGYALIATLNEHSPVILLMLFIVIMSIGHGMFQAPNNSLVMSTVPKEKLGIAGSINALVRNLGMVLGTSTAMLLLHYRMGLKVGYKVVDYIEGRDDIFIYGMRGVYLFTTGICVVGIVITAWRLYSSKKPRSTDAPKAINEEVYLKKAE